MHLSKFTLLSILALTAASRAFACDLCSCYTPRLQVVHERPIGFYAGVAEQFTHFSIDRFNGDKVDNPTGQHLDSSITQAVLGATFLHGRVALQVNVPYIYRSYERPEGLEMENGDESGLGDLSVLAHVVLFRTESPARAAAGACSQDSKAAVPMRREEADFSASIGIFAGVKFPTGDPGRLEEELQEGHSHAAPAEEAHAEGGHEEHAEAEPGHSHEAEGDAPESGIHGHDLALGSGSYDGIFGMQAQVRYKALFFQAETQYALRSEGRYSYRYADDLQWSGGPGVYLYRRDRDAIGLQCVVSGETKGYDNLKGERALDTGITSLYVGPRITAAVGKVRGEVGVDLPVIMNTTAFQTTPEYRIRAGFSVQF